MIQVHHMYICKQATCAAHGHYSLDWYRRGHIWLKLQNDQRSKLCHVWEHKSNCTMQYVDRKAMNYFCSRATFRSTVLKPLACLITTPTMFWT